jgi:hypothetical protein
VLGRGEGASANIWTDHEGARANILAAVDAALAGQDAGKSSPPVSSASTAGA